MVADKIFDEATKHFITERNWTEESILNEAKKYKTIKEWRWSLTETGVMTQHSGGQEELRDAMNDVATTVEYILDNELKEE